MSTSTPASTKKPKASHAAGKCETLEMDIVLSDRLNHIIKEPDQEVTVGLSFDILDNADSNYATVVFREFVPEKKVVVRTVKGSSAFTGGSYHQLTELMQLEDNIESFVKALKAKGYRISNEKEFVVWHTFHCVTYNNNPTKPTRDSINGGFIGKGELNADSQLLEAGYARKAGSIHISDPAETTLGMEISLMFGSRDEARPATLLKRI